VNKFDQFGHKNREDFSSHHIMECLSCTDSFNHEIIKVYLEALDL
jgi:hypothetical protein